MAEPTMKELRAQAKAAGINSFGMKKVTLIAALGGGVVQQVAGSRTTTGPKVGDPVVGLQPNPRADRPTDREETGRRQRIPLGSAKFKLAYEDRPGYHRHWMNDRSNRIHDAERAGYTFVEALNDGRKEKVSRRVGSHEDGSPMSAYLMEIRQEFYTEDQAAKQKQVDAIDAAILHGGAPHDAEAQDQSAFYTPDEGSSIRVET